MGRANPPPTAGSGSRPCAPEPNLRLSVDADPRVTRTGTQLSSDSTDAAQLGRVVGHFGLAVEVLVADGERRRIRVARGAPSLVVGDRVRVSSAGPVLLPRDTVLQRRDARGRSRVIAANLNVLGISIAAQPAAPAGYVDCAIVAARAAGIDPVLVVNKCDQLDSRELFARIRDEYAAAGIRVFAVSALDGRGLDELRTFLAVAGSGGERRGAFIGTSGVGKSSLLNALVPGLDLAVGEVNRFTRQGRHVTTRSSLHALSDGGELIDTPGFRDFLPVALPPAELARHFAGFEPCLAQGCRFRNCLHRDEPDCRVAAEVASGRIASARHRAYLRILGDLERVERSSRRGGR